MLSTATAESKTHMGLHSEPSYREENHNYVLKRIAASANDHIDLPMGFAATVCSMKEMWQSLPMVDGCPLMALGHDRIANSGI